MGPVLLCARLGGMAVSAHRTQTRSVSAYRRPECLLKSRMCERHLSGSERAWAATFGEHPVYSTCALYRGRLLPRPPNRQDSQYATSAGSLGVEIGICARRSKLRQTKAVASYRTPKANGGRGREPLP